MKLSIGTLAIEKRFGRRVRTAVLGASWMVKRLKDVPTHPGSPSAVLVTVTDHLAPGAIREEQDVGDLYQVMVGLTPDASENELLQEIVSAVRRAVALAPFVAGDRARVLDAIAPDS